MNFQIHTTWDVQEEAWEKLLTKSLGLRTIFQTWCWNYCLWEKFQKPRRELYLLTLKDAAGDYSVIAPWIVENGVLTSIGSPERLSDYSDVLYASEKDLEVLISEVSRSPRKWNTVRIPNLRSDSPTCLHLVTALKRNGIFAWRRFQYDAPARQLGDAAEDKDLVTRKSLKRHTLYFEKNGGLALTHLMTDQELNEELPTFYNQHCQRRRAADDVSPFEDVAYRDLFQTLSIRLRDRGWLKFSKLTLEPSGRKIPLAYHWGCRKDGIFTWYKPSFNTEYQKKSPGEALLQTLFLDAVNSRSKEFDFTIGDESFKYRFTNQTRQAFCLEASRSRVVGCLRYGFWKLKRFVRFLFIKKAVTHE